MIYVSMTDKFMSSWGMAKGKKNKLIFECETYEEAKVVANNAHRRSEMSHIRIGDKPQHLRKSMGREYHCGPYFVQIKNKAEYGTWYKEGSFK
jgi:hypothetical protein